MKLTSAKEEDVEMEADDWLQPPHEAQQPCFYAWKHGGIKRHLDFFSPAKNVTKHWVVKDGKVATTDKTVGNDMIM